MFIYTFNDVMALIVVILVTVFFVISAIKNAIRYARCKHDGKISETESCDAICCKCGKNLGFIDNYRNKVSTK